MESIQIPAEGAVAPLLDRWNRRALDTPLLPHFGTSLFPEEGAKMTWKASILNAMQDEEQEVTGNAAEAVVALARRAMTSRIHQDSELTIN